MSLPVVNINFQVHRLVSVILQKPEVLLETEQNFFPEILYDLLKIFFSTELVQRLSSVPMKVHFE